MKIQTTFVIIWASGFRNPFSIKVAGGRVFVTDNGPQVDRFVEARAGDDFLYDGSNDSLAINPLFLWERSVSPVQMDYNPARVKELRFPGDLIHSFFIAQSGSPIEPAGKSDHGSKTVVALGVDVTSGKVTSVPKPLLAYKGKGKQLPVGLALGPDGLYVVPLLPDSDGKSAILKLTYAPENEHAYTIDNLAPEALIKKYSCLGCHKIDGRGVGHNGPEIIRFELANKLIQRLNSPEYAVQSADIDTLTIEPFVSFHESRIAVRNAEGKEKAKTWLLNRLKEPRFDQKISLMPNLGIPNSEANIIADWLLEDRSAESTFFGLKRIIKNLLPQPGIKYFLVIFSLGAISGSVLLLLFLRLIKLRDTR